MAWIESHQDLKEHPKVSDLMAAMGWDLDTTLGKLHRFWWWCVDYAEDGDLRKHNDNRIAQAMGVAIADARRLVEAMVAACWLDRKPYFRVHDWWDYAGRLLQVKYGKSDPGKWQKIRGLYRGTATETGTGTETRAVTDTVSGVATVSAAELTNQPNQPTNQAGGAPPREAGEVPTVEEAIAQVHAAGIPPDFVRFVYADWSSRAGKDGAGNLVVWQPYVTKRWAREQVEWRAGTHRGKAAAAAGAASSGGLKSPKPVGAPAKAEVHAYVREKWGDDLRHANWAVSFHAHWGDPKRNWQRNGRLIDWKVELTAQVAKLRAAP